nr:MAG TPA: hypothetical protein [Caudoviricetes sp.]
MGISMKFKNITAIKNEIVKLIDENQDIRRYMTYLTDSPLSKKAKLNNGKLVDQPDITESLIEKTIIPYMYFEEVVEKAIPIMFVYMSKGDMSNSTVGDNYLVIEILVPTKANILQGLGEERCANIADTITDILDDKKLSKGLTSIEFVSWEQYRVSKDAEYVGLALAGKIKTSNMRRR